MNCQHTNEKVVNMHATNDEELNDQNDAKMSLYKSSSEEDFRRTRKSVPEWRKKETNCASEVNDDSPTRIFFSN